eukprot:COSAG04_NODE_190_length_20948_cov_7.298863_9_plen_817_part_00
MVLVAQEYLGAAELTAAKFVEVGSDGRSEGLAKEVSRWLEPGRWFRTGDVGRWHGDGLTASVVTAPTLASHEEKQMEDEEKEKDGAQLLEVLGRVDSQIKLRGFRIELGEVEAALRDHALVDAAAVALYTPKHEPEPEPKPEPEPVSEPESEPEPEPEPEPESKPEPRLVAYLSLPPGVSPEAWAAGGEAAVRVHCRRHLPVHAAPTQFVRMDALPLTASGKLDRQALPSPPPLVRSHGGNAGSEARAMTTMERTVAEAWAGALGLKVEQISLEDNFFALGGSSVSAVAMVQRLAAAHQQQAEAEQGATRADWSHDDPRMRYCTLFRKPRLVDYAASLEWIAVAAPTRSTRDTSAFASRLGDGNAAGAGRLGPEELLGMLDAALPGEDDEVQMLNAALGLAARGGHAQVAAALLDARACPDAGHTKKKRGEAPLMLAAGNGHETVVRLLLCSGATPNLPDKSSRTAAHLAASGGHASLLRWMLVEGGCASEVKDANKWTLQHHAAWHGRRDVLEMLLRLKAAQSLALWHERSQREAGQRSELQLQRELDALRHDETALLAHQRLEPGLGGGMAELSAAVHTAEAALGPLTEWTAGQLSCKFVRDWSFVIDCKDRWHRTPLSWALFRNHADAAQLLIDGGARLDWSNPFPIAKQHRNNNAWNTSLHLAVQAAAGDSDGQAAVPSLAEDSSQQADGSDRFAALRALLSHPEVRDRLASVDHAGRTALHEAAALVFTHELPKKAGAPADDGRIEASMERAAEGVRLLLEAARGSGGDGERVIDVADHAGRTALHRAVAAGQIAAVRCVSQAPIPAWCMA